MGVGPLIGAAGLALLARLDADPDYLTEVLPALLLFGLGLSMTVAPLTTTVLDSVEERHVGVASGVNNAVARVAGVLAIAALGAVISAQFASALDERTAGEQLSAEARPRSTTPRSSRSRAATSATSRPPRRRRSTTTSSRRRSRPSTSGC